MLNQDELKALKDKMPRNYTHLVINEYKMTTGQSISTRSVFAFFAGKTYSVELHNATLSVAEKNRQTLSVLKKRTSDVINNN